MSTGPDFINVLVTQLASIGTPKHKTKTNAKKQVSKVFKLRSPHVIRNLNRKYYRYEKTKLNARENLKRKSNASAGNSQTPCNHPLLDRMGDFEDDASERSDINVVENEINEEIKNY